ncbi:MAG: hypothetical protein ABIU05_04460 [Nitrospirales bacterium]
MNFDEILLGDTIAYSRKQGYDTYSFLSGAQGRGHTQLAYPASLADPTRALLEIRDPIIRLVPAGFQINPPRRMILSAQIRLIGSNDEIVLDDQVATEEFGLTGYLGEWTADSAKLFRDEARHGMHRLALAITEQAFFQKFPERRFSIDTFSNGYFTGLEP